MSRAVSDPAAYRILRSDAEAGGAAGGELSVAGAKLVQIAASVLDHLADGVNFGTDSGTAVLNDLVDDNVDTVRLPMVAVWGGEWCA